MTWQCETCAKPLKSHGVARHRSMHRDRHDGPVVMKKFTALYVETYTYDWREADPQPGDSEPGGSR